MQRPLLIIVACLALTVAGRVDGAEAPVALPAKAPPIASYDWTGFHVGGHFGYGAGSFGPGTDPILGQAAIFPSTLTGFVGGFQAGYDIQLPNDVVLGLEAAVSFPSPIDRQTTVIGPFNTTFDYFGTTRARIGHAFGSVLPYITGGGAWGQSRVNINDADDNVESSKWSTHPGWTVGAGIEYALTSNWTAKVEYSYIDLGPKTVSLVGVWPVPTVDPKLHLVMLGLNYRLLNETRQDGANVRARNPSEAPDDWSIHGQSTFIPQAYPSFRSPYEGTNSLPGKGQGRETWTATAFVGRRLWDGGEFYFDPELAQGFGVASTLGLAGFSNGEAQKAGAEYPKVRAQRYFFRQTFGLGGEQEAVEDGPNQVAGKRDIDRITLTVGRIAIGDIFDANSYAHDPRADFMNWSMWSSVAYDFPADLPGFTRGAVLELNRKDWALRGGLFQVPTEPNSDVLVFNSGGAVAEFEQRYSVLDQPGKIRLGAFANQGHTGNYDEALSIASADASIDINDAMVSTRTKRLKYGFYVNAEQAINKDIGIFARASWNDGQNEILSFTDVDRSLSGGVSIKGGSWGRSGDTLGFAGAINGLSGPHRDYLAAGGLGLLIGDGALNYRAEKIIETYYALNLSKWTTLSFDYQFISSPAYNADRGPVHLFASRVHAEF